jgi:hypothetical protein
MGYIIHRIYYPGDELFKRRIIQGMIHAKHASPKNKQSYTEAVRHEQVISDAGWSKLDFDERDKCKPVLLRLSLAGNLGKKPLMSLYDSVAMGFVL